MNLWAWVKPGFVYRRISLSDNTCLAQGVIYKLPAESPRGLLEVRLKGRQEIYYSEPVQVELGYAEGSVQILKPEVQ